MHSRQDYGDQQTYKKLTVPCYGDDLKQEIRTLTEAPGKDIVPTGSITLAHELLRKGLVDELRLLGNPVVLSRGRCLFPERWTAPDLQLTEELAIHHMVFTL